MYHLEGRRCRFPRHRTCRVGLDWDQILVPQEAPNWANHPQERFQAFRLRLDRFITPLKVFHNQGIEFEPRGFGGGKLSTENGAGSGFRCCCCSGTCAAWSRRSDLRRKLGRAMSESLSRAEALDVLLIAVGGVLILGRGVFAGFGVFAGHG